MNVSYFIYLINYNDEISLRGSSGTVQYTSVFLMLYPFPNVYRYGCEFRKRYTDILDYAVYGVLLILFCTFGYADNDFYHYEGLFKRICSTGLNVHLEPIYYWLIRNVTSNYLVWRFIVWSGTVILSLWTIKRLKLDVRIGLLIFVLFYINIISVMRGNLGIAILFLAFHSLSGPLIIGYCHSYSVVC